jgi:hypothetical protein
LPKQQIVVRAIRKFTERGLQTALIVVNSRVPLAGAMFYGWLQENLKYVHEHYNPEHLE